MSSDGARSALNHQRGSQIRLVTREPAIFAAPAPDVGACRRVQAKPRPFAVLVGDATGDQLLVVYFRPRFDSDMWFHDATQTRVRGFVTSRGSVRITTPQSPRLSRPPLREV